MTYFMLPKLSQHLKLDDISLHLTDNEDKIFTISLTLKSYLNNIKKNINNCSELWDIYKKYTNPYEYIHSIISLNIKYSISKLKPLSRAFYKMIEICNIFNIFDLYPSTINSFHLAEGPGGFIEAFIYLRKNSQDKYYGMTLISDNNNIPSWKKSKQLLMKNPNIILDNGITKTGDLMDKNNLLYCLDKYHNSIDIVTGDGGFDFSVDFNKQEQISSKLIFSQICFAFAIQKFGGTFILKIFDIFTEATIDLLYLLSNYYNKIFIIKPNTSRIANSEKYIVCKNFRLKDSKELVMKLSKIYDHFNSEKYIKRFLNIDIPYYFINKIEEINAIYGQQQIENINSTLNIIDNNKTDKLELYRKNNITKCIHWCQKYNIPFNKQIHTSNIFIVNDDNDGDNDDNDGNDNINKNDLM